MKNRIISLYSIAIVALLIITSCGKYEEGPDFSLRSKKARIKGDWVLEKYTYNDEDRTELAKDANGANFVLKIEDSEYKILGNNADEGTWELGEDKDDIYFKSNDPDTEETAFRILRLKNKEMWLRHTKANGDVEVIHYEAEED